MISVRKWHRQKRPSRRRRRLSRTIGARKDLQDAKIDRAKNGNRSCQSTDFCGAGSDRGHQGRRRSNSRRTYSPRSADRHEIGHPAASRTGCRRRAAIPSPGISAPSRSRTSKSNLANNQTACDCRNARARCAGFARCPTPRRSAWEAGRPRLPPN